VSREPQLERELADSLGERLRDLRMRVGMTQEQVAHAAGLNRNHYQLLESGLSDRAKNTPANPRLSTLVSLCRVYDVSVPELVVEVFRARRDLTVEYRGEA